MSVDVDALVTVAAILVLWLGMARGRMSSADDAGWGSLVARQAHNLKVGSSNLPPATKSGAAGCRAVWWGAE